MSRKLIIDAIEKPTDLQQRAAIHSDYVHDLAEAIKGGATLPPVIVFADEKGMWLADGFHRYEAHKLAGEKYIEVELKTGSRRDAQWYAVGANQAHGLRRSNEDKRRAVQLALAHPQGKSMSSRAIAEHVGVSAHVVEQIRGDMDSGAHMRTCDQPAKRIGKDGKAYQLPAPAEVKTDTQPAPENGRCKRFHLTDDQPAPSTPPVDDLGAMAEHRAKAKPPKAGEEKISAKHRKDAWVALGVVIRFLDRASPGFVEANRKTLGAITELIKPSK